MNKLKIKNENFFKKLKDNELLLKNKNSIIEQLNEENIMIKNRFEELEKSFDKLSEQINILNIPNKENNLIKKENINSNINNNYKNENKKNAMDMGMVDRSTDELKIMEMKMKNCENELNEKNIMLNLINDKNNLLNNLLGQKNNVIKSLQDEKIKNRKNIDILTSKNIELNNLLNQKNGDLIQYQKIIIEKEKKIKTLIDYLNKAKNDINNLNLI